MSDEEIVTWALIVYAAYLGLRVIKALLFKPRKLGKPVYKRGRW